MRSYLGMAEEELISKGALHTAREICNQPDLWEEVYALILSKKKQLEKFWTLIETIPELEIILTGAGSSAFLGNIMETAFQKYTGKNTRAIPTTSLATHPTHFFQGKRPLLLISFARSGSSPESLAAVQLANQLCEEVYHLVITCNSQGDLANIAYDSRDLVIILPERANDRSLAMTSSFTSMAFVGYLVARFPDLLSLRSEIDMLIQYGKTAINEFPKKLKELSTLDFNRAVFLGSGPVQGAAEESHLKLQELSDGQVICKFDSYLAFRHGPKAIIDGQTLVVFLLSSDPHVRKYESDLIRAIKSEGKDLHSIGITETVWEDESFDTVLAFQKEEFKNRLDEYLVCLAHVIPAQILGFYKSLALSLKPDLPSVNGNISRVVEGVKIYPYFSENSNIVTKPN